MVLWTVGIVALAAAGLWTMQRRLIYFPGHNVPNVEQLLPGAVELSFATSDGLDLAGWFLAPAEGNPIVIVFNGNAGTRADRAPLAEELAGRGMGVLLIDYRGYGGNPGSPSEAGLALDARAARSFVATERPGTDIVYFGESLGAAVAVELAQEFPPSALILRSPFTSLADVGAVHYPLVARSLLRDSYPSAERIGSIESPVLVIAGSADSIVPADQSQRMHELANEPKELLVVDGADHNDFALLAGQEMIDAVVRFIRDSAAG